MHRSWDAIVEIDNEIVSGWSRRLAGLRLREAALRGSGLWAKGPSDLLSIAGLQRRELVHSALLAWACDPEARHGLGTGLLARLLARTGPVPDLSGAVDIRTEVALSSPDRTDTRADVVVEHAAWTLVIEVKVDAPEQPAQCERLFKDWQDCLDSRFLFVTPRGLRPWTAPTGPCNDAWHVARWSDIADDLDRAVDDAAPGAAAISAAREWSRTLRRL